MALGRWSMQLPIWRHLVESETIAKDSFVRTVRWNHSFRLVLVRDTALCVLLQDAWRTIVKGCWLWWRLVFLKPALHRTTGVTHHHVMDYWSQRTMQIHIWGDLETIGPHFFALIGSKHRYLIILSEEMKLPVRSLWQTRLRIGAIGRQDILTVGTQY